MSWLDKLETQYSIRTGDGKVYNPLWVKASKLRDYNVTEFNYIDVAGSFVDRKRPRGARYNLDIYFQGDDHLDVAKAFDISASDSRPWIITHPYYERLVVQPTSLSFNNDDYNVTHVTGQVIETIENVNPSVTAAPKDTILKRNETTRATLAGAYANNVTPDAADINEMQQVANDAYADGTLSLDTSFGSEYLDALNNAQGLIIDATSEPLQAITALQNLLVAPARFQASVSTRFTSLETSLNRLLTDAANYTTSSSKRLFQVNAGSLVSAMTLTAGTPLTDDYQNRVDVVDTFERLLSNYDSYINALGDLQTDNAGSIDSYIPDTGAIRELTALVNFTLSNLFNIATTAKQQRDVLLTHDTNWILLAHKYYWLVDEVDNVQKLMRENNVGILDILIANAGRVITYYV